MAAKAVMPKNIVNGTRSGHKRRGVTQPKISAKNCREKKAIKTIKATKSATGSSKLPILKDQPMRGKLKDKAARLILGHAPNSPKMATIKINAIKSDSIFLSYPKLAK